MGLSVWLAVTFAIAFLREAKAVRDARKLLENGQEAAAWQALEPFLQSHPTHEQALLLCAKANVLLGNPTKAGECLSGAPETTADLVESVGPVVTEKALAAGCDAKAFEGWFNLAEKMGEEKTKEFDVVLFQLIPNCYSSSRQEELPKIVAFLAQKNRAMALVNDVFVPLIQDQPNAWSAGELAREAIRLVPEGEEVVNSALEQRRRKKN